MLRSQLGKVLAPPCHRAVVWTALPRAWPRTVWQPQAVQHCALCFAVKWQLRLVYRAPLWGSSIPCQRCQQTESRTGS